jgi:ATP-dependent DNA helicase RecQ
LKILEILNSTFNLTSFKEGQHEAIDAIIEKKDLIAVLPTGGGKSLIYQLPSVIAKAGITIVISPLISLMKDQVDSLNRLGIVAAFCNSSQDELEQLKIISDSVNGKIKLLYISPERAMSSSFLNYYSKMKVNFIAVDEAHCVSQWGHDFRPEYRELSKLRDVKKDIFFVALTATATKKVILDIQRSLGLRDPIIIKKSFLRKNLSFNVEYFTTDFDKEKRLLDLLNSEIFSKVHGKGIIYSATRSKADELNKFLQSNGIKSTVYHAGKSDSIRLKNQDTYFKGKSRLMIATNAFGMGVDSSDVRLIVHYQTPASIESYYQEAGRAGRDGMSAKCILFFQKKDLVVQNFIIRKESNFKNGETLFGEMKSYIFSETCRQKIICSYFGEEIESCGNCDLCIPSDLDSDRKDYLDNTQKLADQKELKKIYMFNEMELDSLKSIFQKLPGIFGKNMIISILRGSKLKKILRLKLDKKEEFGKLKHIPEEAISFKIEEWLKDKVLIEKGQKYPLLYLKEFPPQNRKEKVAEEIKLGIRKEKFVTPEQNLVKERPVD